MVMTSDAILIGQTNPTSGRLLNSVAPWLAWLARLAVAGVFLWAAIPKIIDPAGFALSIHRYELLPLWLEAPSAILVPWLEVVLAIALCSTRNWRIAAAILTIGLLIVFTAMITWAWLYNLDIDCGCFATDGSAERIGLWHFARNACLLIAVIGSLWMDVYWMQSKTIPRKPNAT